MNFMLTNPKDLSLLKKTVENIFDEKLSKFGNYFRKVKKTLHTFKYSIIMVHIT